MFEKAELGTLECRVEKVAVGMAGPCGGAEMILEKLFDEFRAPEKMVSIQNKEMELTEGAVDQLLAYLKLHHCSQSMERLGNNHLRLRV